MRSRKAQAAVEFLMTYGWAILAMGVVIGALSQFGFFDFQNNVPNQCKLGSEFICDVASLDESGDLYLEFTAANKPLNVSKIRCEYDDGTTTESEYDDMILSPGKNSVVLACEPSPAPEISEKEKIVLKIVYAKVEPDAFKHVADGDVITSVMDVDDSSLTLDYSPN
ncbi:MAG: hypothetical protein ACLFTH_02890 [Candidatus Woesearchaeota archaeon]